MLIRLLFSAAFGLAALVPDVAQAQTGQGYMTPPVPRAVSPPVVRRLQTRAEFERGLMRSEGAPLFVAIRRNFPAESPSYFNGLYRAYASTIGASPEAQGQALAREQHAFYLSLLPHLRLAPDADLLRATQARVAVYEALQRTDVNLCARISHGNSSPSVPPLFKQLNGRALIALVEAAGAGRRTPVPRAPFTDEDRRLVSATFPQVDPTGDLLPMALAEGEVSSPDPDRQCRYVIALLHLALALPPATGVKMEILLLARSVAGRDAEQ